MQPHLPVRVRSGVRNRQEDLLQRMFPAAGELPLALLSHQETPRQVRRGRAGSQGLSLLNAHRWRWLERPERALLGGRCTLETNFVVSSFTTLCSLNNKRIKRINFK